MLNNSSVLITNDIVFLAKSLCVLRLINTIHVAWLFFRVTKRSIGKWSNFIRTISGFVFIIRDVRDKDRLLHSL